MGNKLDLKDQATQYYQLKRMSYEKKSVRERDFATGKCEKSNWSGRSIKNEDPLDSIWLVSIAKLICS